MALLSPLVGQTLLLKYMLNNTSPTNIEMRLYTNNLTPAATDAVGSYTESSAAGYAAVTLTGTAWTVSSASATVVANYAQQTFTYTTSDSVYGYFVTKASKAEVLWAERFSGTVPLNIPTGGGSISITPRLTLQ